MDSDLPFSGSAPRKPARRAPRASGAAQAGEDVTSQFAARGPQAVSVSALLAMVKGALSSALPPRVIVVGELSNFKAHTSGHMYFSLKDAGGCINAAMFRGAASRLRFEPHDGLEVVVEGRVDLYEARGQLQLYVETMTPKGAGALELAFRQLQEKLQREGLFDPAHKIPLPRFPRAVGVITSATGAAVRDIRRTLCRRWPGVGMFLVPVLVQGDGSAGDIASAIAAMDASAERLGIDTIIVGRGGGSLEDLWAFNEEAVARAIFACRTPIISGVGHEVDVTIADLVADVRAATPTAAAELAVPDANEIRRQVGQLAGRLVRSTNEAVIYWRRALEGCLRSVVFRDPRSRLRNATQRIDELAHRLRSGVVHNHAQKRHRLADPAARLAALHPARLHADAAHRLAELTNRLRWVLGGRSKRAGDALQTLEARLAASHPRHRLAMARQRIESIARHLEALGHRSILARGFSITRDGEGKILRTVAAAAAGQVVETELVDGKFKSVVGTGGVAVPKRKPKPGDETPGLFDE